MQKTTPEDTVSGFIKDAFTQAGLPINILNMCGREVAYSGNKYSNGMADNYALFVEIEDTAQKEAMTLVFFDGDQYKKREVMELWFAKDYFKNVAYFDAEGFTHDEVDPFLSAGDEDNISFTGGVLSSIHDELCCFDDFQDICSFLADKDYFNISISLKKSGVSQYHVDSLTSALKEAKELLLINSSTSPARPIVAIGDTEDGKKSH